MLLPSTINDQLCAATPDAVTTQLVMDTYLAGHLVSVSRERDAEVDFKLMDEVEDVWILAFRKPRASQRRLLGRFLAKDVFVGLGLYARGSLYGGNYTIRGQEVIDEWQRIFGDQVPVSSTRLDDCFGHVYRVEGDEDDDEDDEE